MSESDKTIWFRAKRYGWGWGLPVVWQGWLVFLIYLAATIGGYILFMPEQPGVFTVICVVTTLALVAVCWLKGEKLRWRWGDD
jgi:hypothetical protein